MSTKQKSDTHPGPTKKITKTTTPQTDRLTRAGLKYKLNYTPCHSIFLWNRNQQYDNHARQIQSICKT